MLSMVGFLSYSWQAPADDKEIESWEDCSVE